MNFNTQVFISFGQTDPAGILFFAEIFKLHHQVLEQWAAQTQLGWEVWFSAPEWAAPIRHAECDYKKPLLAGRSYEVRLRLSALGTSSCRWQSEFLNGDVTHAVVQTVHVFIDKKHRASQPIPTPLREMLEQCQKGSEKD